MTEPAPQAMSEAEYLRTERESPFKREYVGGFVYPRSSWHKRQTCPQRTSRPRCPAKAEA